MIAIQAATDPGCVVEMCTYGCLIIHEVCTHGGEGWVAYDTLFCQHTAAHLSTSWASLDSSIHAATLVVMRSGTGVLCSHYSGSDHQSGHCALASLHTPLPLFPPTNTQVPSHLTVANPEAGWLPIFHQYNCTTSHLQLFEPGPAPVWYNLLIPAHLCYLQGGPSSQSKSLWSNTSRQHLSEAISLATPSKGFTSNYKGEHRCSKPVHQFLLTFRLQSRLWCALQ